MFGIRVMSTVFHRVEYIGLDKILPEKRYVLASNHVGAMDAAYIINKVDNVGIMAKAELFKKPIIKDVVKVCGAFPIERGKKDVKAVIHASHIITENHKHLLIFPEGTRNAIKKGVKAKEGAVCIAEIAKVDIIPVHITEKQGLFKKYTIKFGEPMSVTENIEGEDSKARRRRLTKELMERIYSMREDDEK